MVNIILASHGEFVEGLFESSKMIFGEQDNLKTVTLMPNEGPEDLHGKLVQAVESFGEDAQVLFMVDLWGGSPFNQVSVVYEDMKERSAIVSGVNLPMLLEALGSRMGINRAHELASHIISKEVIGVRALPEDVEPTTQVEETTTSTDSPVSLEPGTVIGDGKIDYRLVRIDTRLLHGQVSTNWVKSLNPNRIIVVSDSVSKDEMRKTLIQQAAPSGVRTHTIPVDKFVEIDKDPRFGNAKALILFETPQDVLKAVEAGVEFEHINIGSMAHSTGKVLIDRAISVDKADVETLTALKEHGITFDTKRIPSDTSEDLEKLLRDKKLI